MNARAKPREPGAPLSVVEMRATIATIPDFESKVRGEKHRLGLSLREIARRMGMNPNGITGVLGQGVITVPLFRDLSIALEKPLEWWHEDLRYGSLPTNRRLEIRRILQQDIDEALTLLSKGKI